MLENLNRSVFQSMRSKKELCQSWKLYVITWPTTDLVKRVREAVLGGAQVIQLRDKLATDDDLARQAKMLLEVTSALRVPLIVNDRVSVAKTAGADGVHLGQEDTSLEFARSVLGEGAIFGRSTHSLEQALAAEKEGFDYIGVGPVFETPTKAGRQAVGLDCVSAVSRNVRIPFVAIGGIDPGNAGKVKKAGARAIAVVRAVLGSADPRSAARTLRKSVEG